MVEAHITRMAGFNLAVDRDHLLLEEPLSNSILSLHPAILPSETSSPLLFSAVSEYRESDDGVLVEWEPVRGIRGTTRISVVEAMHLQISCKFQNISNEDHAVGMLCPLCVPEKGRGAWALGAHDLRVIGEAEYGRDPRLLELDGGPIVSRGFMAFCATGGRPSLLVGLLGDDPSGSLFSVMGARGKVLSVDLNALPEERILAPGESVESAPYLLCMGNFDLAELVKGWRTRLGGQGEWIPDLSAMDYAGGALRFEALAPMQESVAEEEAIGGEEDADCDEMEAGDDAQDVDAEREHWVGKLRSCADFQRTQRAALGVWPRFGAGRRHAPASGMSVRGRSSWRRI